MLRLARADASTGMYRRTRITMRQTIDPPSGEGTAGSSSRTDDERNRWLKDLFRTGASKVALSSESLSDLDAVPIAAFE